MLPARLRDPQQHASPLPSLVDLVCLFLVVIWLALVYWTFADARRRIADPLLVGCATLASLFPFVGTIVYMIVRPPEYLDDVRERELEIQAAEARLAELGSTCARTATRRSRRTSCAARTAMRKLKDPCTSCGKPLDPSWQLCPYCETEVGQSPSARRLAAGPGQPVGASRLRGDR